MSSDSGVAPEARGDAMPSKCPRCDSPAPHLHPAVQFEGEVQPCPHEFHFQDTPQNRRYLQPKVAEAAPSVATPPPENSEREVLKAREILEAHYDDVGPSSWEASLPHLAETVCAELRLLRSEAAEAVATPPEVPECEFCDRKFEGEWEKGSVLVCTACWNAREAVATPPAPPDDPTLTAGELHNAALACASQGELNRPRGEGWEALCQKLLRVAESFNCYSEPKTLVRVAAVPPVPPQEKSATPPAPPAWQPPTEKP